MEDVYAKDFWYCSLFKQIFRLVCISLAKQKRRQICINITVGTDKPLARLIVVRCWDLDKDLKNFGLECWIPLCHFVYYFKRMLVCWSMDISCNRLEDLFKFYLWDQSHVTLVWNTRKTGDINDAARVMSNLNVFLGEKF